jgi:hypothetical protein
MSVQTIFEKSVPGRRAFVAPELDAAAAGDLRARDRPALHDALDEELPR